MMLSSSPLASLAGSSCRLPFASCRRLQRTRRTDTRANASNRAQHSALPASLGGLLVASPAWAEEVVERAQGATEQIQNADLPSSLPSADEVQQTPSPEIKQTQVPLIFNSSVERVVAACIERADIIILVCMPTTVTAQVISNAPQTGASILDLFADNPIIVVGVLFLAAIPIALNFLGGGALGVKQVNAAGAVEGLSSDPATVLVDIRSREEAKQQGSPNLSALKKKAIVLPFTRSVQGDIEEVEDFVEKFGKLKQIKAESSIIVLDSYGKEAPRAAKQLAKLAGRVYFVRDGAVGANGWKESGQPWREPGKSLLNLDNLAEDFKSQPTFAKAGVAAGAVGVAAAVLFQEAGTVLELAAVAAAGAFAVPRFLSTAPGDSAQKQQVKEFVEDSEKDAKAAASKADSAGSRLGKKAEEAGSDLGSSVQEAAQKVQDTAQDAAKTSAEEASDSGNPAEQVASSLDGVVSEASDAASKNAGEAREWIETWRKENTKA